MSQSWFSSEHGTEIKCCMIEVQSAGVDGVNDTCTPDGDLNNVTMYRKRGMREGEVKRFSLYNDRVTLNKSTPSWRFSSGGGGTRGFIH